ncbi:MAG: spore coat associated protein CotJA [Oscillospiraceae bacterium]|nr:spore coat associated protein CotJA [Oscillospiraceae bacterium]
MPLAMAYVPPQSWGEIYPNDRALERGTLFPALDLPFKCERGCSR